MYYYVTDPYTAVVPVMVLSDYVYVTNTNTSNSNTESESESESESVECIMPFMATPTVQTVV